MALLLFVPVLHQGYLELFDRHKNEGELYIIGEDLIGEMPQLKREIRRLDPELMAKVIDGLGLFKKVEVLRSQQLGDLAEKHLVVANEADLKDLIGKYLPNAKVTYDNAFLRWDANKVREQIDVQPDTETTDDQLANKLMAMAEKAAGNSADWFRQVGAVLWRDGQVLAAAYNKRQPSDHQAYILGDPRNYLEMGSETYLREVLHAEQALIAQAAREGMRVEGASLFVTTIPCPDCASVVAAAGIKECFFLDGYSQLGVVDQFKEKGIKLIRVIKNKS